MAMTKDLGFELKMCGKKVYMTYYELWDNPGFDEWPIREQMKQAGKDEDGIMMCISSGPQNWGERAST